jgi:hypothetical protein
MIQSLRRGKSLIEMLVIISVLSVVMSLAGGTLILLLRCERQVKRDLDQERSLVRLGQQFRADAHAATGAEVGPACVLKLAGGQTIRYAAGNAGVTREVMDGEKVEHRDQFALPAPADVRFESPAEASGKLVRLLIQPSSDTPNGIVLTARPATIEAALNLYAGATP